MTALPALSLAADTGPAPGRDLRRMLLLDGLLAVAVAAVTLPSLFVYLPVSIPDLTTGVAVPSRWSSLAYTVALTAPLTLRRVRPRTVHAVMVALSIVPYVAPSVLSFDTTPLLVSLFSVASILRGWRFTAAAALGTAGVLLWPSLPFTYPDDIGGVPFGWRDVLVIVPTVLLPVGLAVVAGRALQQERSRAEASQRAAVAAVLAGEAQAAAAVAAERRRLAAELHDIVAHHVSLMVVQAEAGPFAAARGAAGGAASTFGAIADRGRTALGELDRLLGVLRRDGDAVPGSAPLAPLPTLGEVGELVASAERAGVPILLTRFDLPSGLDAALSATGHRIVQECITNVIKHGDHAEPATLAIAHEGGALRITAENRIGARAPAPAASRVGHGLLSIRSRVEVFGGTLHTTEADGRFRAEAVLPLDPAADRTGVTV